MQQGNGLQHKHKASFRAFVSLCSWVFSWAAFLTAMYHTVFYVSRYRMEVFSGLFEDVSSGVNSAVPVRTVSDATPCTMFRAAASTT